jgi:serine protease Do
MRLRRNHAVVLGVVGLLLTACGGGDESSPTVTDSTGATTTSSAAESAPTEPSSPDVTEPTVPAEDVINSFDEVQPAVIQIVAQGSFRDPEVGMVTGAGRGSGFIISEDGLAVTNNHVVTGAATLEIFIGGDSSRSYNATVVGVSECNDLALIQLDSDPLPHLEWTTSAPTVGTEVYAAGFPRGDPEFTMTRGIVAKANAPGDTPQSSIDSTIEHDANIQPGNSGGPLVDADGRVDGVNYGGNESTNQTQFYAIEATLAKEVVDHLKNGDFESLGINGTAVADDESDLSGVWVAGTAPGSPASITGILPGDIVTQLNGLPIGTDGTMKDYCDVIRTAGDRPITVEVLRFDTQEILRGEINGTKPLELVVSLADEVEGEAGPTGDSGTAYSGSQTLIDDTGLLTVDVPTEWFDVMTSPLDDGTPLIAASTSLDAFLGGQFDVPGLFFTSVPPIAPEQIAATTATYGPGEGGCAVDEGLFEYDDGFFVGQYHVWSECGGIDAVNVTIVANSVHGDAAAILGVQLVTDADFDALDTIMATFDLIN